MKAKPSKASTSTLQPPTTNQLTETAVDPVNLVAALAYSKYESSGYTPGNDVEHWLEAESELTPVGDDDY